MAEYIPTIGLEIHAELKTQTKMFCDSKNDPDEKRPNWNVCPVCMAHPGTLPVINREAVKHVLRVGVAVGGTIADYTEFDRKNYFYPDIPKGYQISQYAYPLVTGGELHGIALTRIHLEEDTARSQHLSSEASAKKGAESYSLVDFNRAGVPLMELVTEPVIHSAREAGDFARELQLLLRYLGVSDADMEKGHLRVEVNISVSKDGKLGTKTEIKNINSFRAAEKAIEFETQRQTTALEAGEKIIQETRGWDDAKGETFSQREKESSHDYRYFPEPDLPKLKISEIPEFSAEALKKELPELPWERRERYLALGLKPQVVEVLVADQDKILDWGGEKVFISSGRLFEDAVKGKESNKEFVKLAADFIVSDIPRAFLDAGFRTDTYIPPGLVGSISEMRVSGVLSSTNAVKVFQESVLSKTSDPTTLLGFENFVQQSDENAIGTIVDDVIAQNENVVAEYKKGKDASLQFLVGQGMKLSKGSANPGVLAKLLKEKLS